MNRDLGTGLVLRSISAGYATDRRDLPAFYTEVFSEANGEPDPYIGLWTETLLADDHPATTDDDVWVVVDTTQQDRIVSALLLIPQTWRYESIQMPVGRVEIVATHPDYRRRGLVCALMQAAHERSAALGHNVQAITGIPHYYRQFGYTMAVDLGGHEAIPLTTIRPLAADSTPTYTLRPATPADVPALVAWDRYAGDHALLTTVRSQSEWAYEFTRDPSHVWWLDLLIITDQHGVDVGYMALRQKVNSGQNAFVQCLAYVIGDQASYLATYEDVLRGLKAHLENRYPDDTPNFIHFIAGIHEGFTTLTRARYPAATRDHVYAWYMRIADLPRFMHDIAPVLEQRLQHSAAHRFSGDLTIAFYDASALRLRFEHGRLTTAETIPLATPKENSSADAHLPWNLFLTLIFGYRTLEDLAYILPDCEANGKARLLFSILFPRKRSWIMPLA